MPVSDLRSSPLRGQSGRPSTIRSKERSQSLTATVRITVQTRALPLSAMAPKPRPWRHAPSGIFAYAVRHGRGWDGMGWQQDGQPIYYEAYTCIQKDFGTCKCNSRNRGMNACLTASAISSDLHWVTMATHPKRPRWRAAGAATHHWTASMRCSLPMRSRLDLPDLARASQSFVVSSMDHLPAGPHWPGPNHCNPPASCCRRGQLGAPHHSPPSMRVSAHN